jgi:sugar O-acyltransferase (sialic acid O-acetyltransferase NeuD family)
MISVILIGGGGHSRSCIDVIECNDSISVRGVIVPESNWNTQVLGYPVLGNDDDLEKLIKYNPYAFVAVGQIKTPEPRIRIYENLKRLNAILPAIISSRSYVSRHSRIDEGTIVMHDALINAGVDIGSNCIINSNATIEHDVKIESHVHISTGALVNGGVIVRAGSFIGSGAILREGIDIGEGSVIGAGQVVLKSLPAGSYIRGPK